MGCGGGVGVGTGFSGLKDGQDKIN